MIHGNQLGRIIGFPTVNIRLHRQVNPVKGVYAVKVFIIEPSSIIHPSGAVEQADVQNASRFVRLKSGAFFNGVANIGTRPTINGVNQLINLNGKASKLSLRSKREIEPGCEIIVPSKDKKDKLSLQEIVTMGTLTASMAALVTSMIKLFK